MFKPDDYSQLTRWFKHREMNVPPIELLPNHGYIMDDVAAGFIYLTNSAVAIIDCYIANPESDKNTRDKALNWITIHLIAYAKNSGCRLIKSDTKIKEVITRSKNHGFKEVGQFTSLVREL
jgi:hypothetical protein